QFCVACRKPVDVDIAIRTSQGSQTDTWLRADARGRDGSIRQELAAGMTCKGGRKIIFIGPSPFAQLKPQARPQVSLRATDRAVLTSVRCQQSLGATDDDAGAARHNPKCGIARLVAHGRTRLGSAAASPHYRHRANELCLLAVSIIQRG